MMRIARSILILAAGGAVLAPLCALGHGAEFLSAKLTLMSDAEVRLDVTADFGSNPLIADEAAARDALGDPVRLQSQGELIELSKLTRASHSIHQNWAEFAPASYLPSDTDDQSHQLITASWQWRSQTPEIVFEMPKGKMHDVLLWTQDESNPDAPPKWMLLLAGDQSKAIPVHPRSWWKDWKVFGAGGLAAVLGLLVVRRRNWRSPVIRPAGEAAF